MANCEFCNEEMQNYNYPITFHYACFERAIKAIAKYSESLKPRSKSFICPGNFVVIRDPRETNGPTPNTIYQTDNQAMAVAHKLCEQTRRIYYVAQLQRQIEPV